MAPGLFTPSRSGVHTGVLGVLLEAGCVCLGLLTNPSRNLSWDGVKELLVPLSGPFLAPNLRSKSSGHKSYSLVRSASRSAPELQAPMPTDLEPGPAPPEHILDALPGQLPLSESLPGVGEDES